MEFNKRRRENEFHIKNKILLVFIAILAIVSVAIWAVLQAGGKSNQVPSMERVGISADVIAGYATIEELHKNAQIIAEVEISSVTSMNYGGVVFTLSHANITKGCKGTNHMSNITILETGSIYDHKNYVFNHNEAAKSGDRIIVFLEKYIGPINNDCYVILGAYQGKFTIADHDRIIPPNEV